MSELTDYGVDTLAKIQELENELSLLQADNKALSSLRESERIAMLDVVVELLKATRAYGQFASPHEGWAILREEVDELWDIVKLKPSNRDINKMRDEAKQVAAMAIRFMVDICNH